MANIKLTFDTNAKSATLDMKSLKSSIGAVGGVAKQAFKTVAYGLAGITTASVIALKAFQGQAESEVRLQSATENLGLSYEKNKKKLLDFSNEMQDISKIGDEASNDLTAFFITATGSIEMAMKASRATIAESARTGKSIDTVREQIANAFGGQTSRIERQNQALRGLTKEQWANGEALDVMFKGGEKFLASMRRLDPISNIMGRIGDAMEPIGGALLTVLTPAFDQLEGKIKDVTGELSDNPDSLVSGIQEATKGIASFGVAGLTVLQPMASIVFAIADGLNKIATYGIGATKKLQELTGGASDYIPFFSAQGALANQVQGSSAEIFAQGGQREEALQGGNDAIASALEKLTAVTAQIAENGVQTATQNKNNSIQVNKARTGGEKP